MLSLIYSSIKGQLCGLFRLLDHPCVVELIFYTFNDALQVRNGKKTAILAVVIDKKAKSKTGKKQERVYVIYRPNTGQQVR